MPQIVTVFTPFSFMIMFDGMSKKILEFHHHFRYDPACACAAFLILLPASGTPPAFQHILQDVSV
jgi:hypothetical protein